MAKKIEKRNYCLKVYESFANEFDALAHNAAGSKSEQFSAAIMAYMALYDLDKGLVSSLTNHELTRKKAAKLILDQLSKACHKAAIESITANFAKIIDDMISRDNNRLLKAMSDLSEEVSKFEQQQAKGKPISPERLTYLRKDLEYTTKNLNENCEILKKLKNLFDPNSKSD